MNKIKRPGDQIIDKYMPNCSDEDREIARERLQGLAKILLDIAMREVREEQGLGPAALRSWKVRFL